MPKYQAPADVGGVSLSMPDGPVEIAGPTCDVDDPAVEAALVELGWKVQKNAGSKSSAKSDG